MSVNNSGSSINIPVIRHYELLCGARLIYSSEPQPPHTTSLPPTTTQSWPDRACINDGPALHSSVCGSNISTDSRGRSSPSITPSCNPPQTHNNPPTALHVCECLGILSWVHSRQASAPGSNTSTGVSAPSSRHGSLPVNRHDKSPIGPDAYQ